MKKIFLFIIPFFVLVSCHDDDVQSNNSSIQALKDNVMWKATLIVGTQYPDGKLDIVVNQKNETLIFNTTSSNPQIYTFGVNDSNKVRFEQEIDTNRSIFSTGTDSGDGQIEITEYNKDNNTISGTFKFNAKNITADSKANATISFQEGVFRNIPVIYSLKQ